MKPQQKKYMLENINKKSITEISEELSLEEIKIRNVLKKKRERKKQVDSKKGIISRIKKETFISIALIIVLGFTVYSNSLNGEFIRDDNFLIKDNIYIKNFSHLPKIFTKNIAAGGEEKWNSYRPLQMITYMVDYSLWGLNVRGYHLTNIILHILATLCIYWFVTILYDNRLLSLFTSMLFIVHPIHTEVAAFISGRANSLALIFMLFCFILYIKELHAESITIYILMLLSYILALLSRENTLILPVLLLLYHYTFKKRLKVKKFLPITGIAFIYILLRVTVLKSLLSNILCPTTLFQRMSGFFVAITNYIRLIFLPFHLHMEYGNRLFNFTDPRAVLGILILTSLLIYTFREKHRSNLIFFSISWFFIALLPQSNLYPINAYMAEHWLYLPSIGFFLILSKGLSSIYRTKEFKILAIVFTTSLAAFYSYLTIRQNDYWKEPIAFYKRTLKYAPHSSRTYNHLGLAYRSIGKKEEAIASYKKAIEINPNYADPCNNLGLIYSSIGKKEEAIALYKRAIEIDPATTDAYYNLGMVYKDVGKTEEAIALYKKGIEIDPNCAKAYYNLGIIYDDIGNNKEAISAYKKAIEISPDYADAYYNLGNAYCSIGKNKEAIASFKKSIEINPNAADVHNNLAILYYAGKQYDLAVKHCDKARELGCEVDPEFLKALEPKRVLE